MSINSRQKGAAGEREFTRVLRERGYEAERGCQHCGGTDSPDVKSNLADIHFEVKRTEKLRLYIALKQAIRDAAGAKIPVVAHRKNREEWVVIMRFEDWIKMYEEAHKNAKGRINGKKEM